MFTSVDLLAHANSIEFFAKRTMLMWAADRTGSFFFSFFFLLERAHASTHMHASYTKCCKFPTRNSQPRIWSLVWIKLPVRVYLRAHIQRCHCCSVCALFHVHCRTFQRPLVSCSDDSMLNHGIDVRLLCWQQSTLLQRHYSKHFSPTQFTFHTTRFSTMKSKMHERKKERPWTCEWHATDWNGPEGAFLNSYLFGQHRCHMTRLFFFQSNKEKKKKKQKMTRKNQYRTWRSYRRGKRQSKYSYNEK